MVDVYSPLRYPGGKVRLSRFLVEVIKENRLAHAHYVEPYAGGAGAALRLLCEEYVESICINDADPRIRCFWQAVTRRSDSFAERLLTVPVTVDEWQRQRRIYERRDLRKVFELGFATFFLNRTTRSGIVHNGGPIGGYNQCSAHKIDARFNREGLARRVWRIGAYADRIEVSGEDGLVLLKRINGDAGLARRTLVYLDPPYYGKGAVLYMNRFSHAQHAALASYLRSAKRFAWILTYDDVPEICELYGGFPQLRFALSYSAYVRREGQELLMHSCGVRLPSAAKDALPSRSCAARRVGASYDGL